VLKGVNVSLETYRRTIREGKREAIVQSAQRVFLERGYQGAAMAAIAKDADVSTATLYKHFANKETLFDAVVADRIQQFDIASPPDDIDPSLPLDEGLKQVSASFVELMRDDNTLDMFRVIISEVSRFPELKDKIYTLGRNPFRARLIAYLQMQAKQGAVADVSFTAMAENYIGLITYWFIFARIFNPTANISNELADSLLREARATLIGRLRLLDQG
jgi:TetR/AcrR family transcriptional regulator, regulator of autoinduction and epiphytic fitness